MLESWDILFNLSLEQYKTDKTWGNVKPLSGYELFLQSIGDYSKIITDGTAEDITALFNSNQQWKSKSKGSPFQYLEWFPADANLKKLCSLCGN